MKTKNNECAAVISESTTKPETGKVSTSGANTANNASIENGESNDIYTRAVARMKKALCPQLAQLESELKALNEKRAVLLDAIDEQKQALQAFTLNDFVSVDPDNAATLENYYIQAEKQTDGFTYYFGTSENGDKIETAKSTATVGTRTLYLFATDDKVRALNSYNAMRKAMQTKSNQERQQRNKANKVAELFAQLTPEQKATILAQLNQ